MTDRFKFKRNNTFDITQLKDESLSLEQLMNHIRQNHPMQSNEVKWSLLEPTGHLLTLKKEMKIPKLLKDIGLGASMYLLTIKMLSFYFLFLTVLNLPVMILYLGCVTEELE